jgi:hypothetical protein
MSKIDTRKTPKRTAAAVPDVANAVEFEALSDAEKEAVYQSVDREIPLSETRPPTRAERAEFERWRRRAIAEHRRRRGRPKIGKGTKVVSVSLEMDLLAASDGFAKRNGVKRSEMVAAGLRAVMSDPRLLKAG